MWRIGTAAFGLVFALASTAGAARSPLLRDPALLNIGFVCQWQERCMARQKDAMKRALGFVRKAHPPVWKVQLCNRNASRRYTRVDWIGYNNRIRNPALRPPPPPPRRSKRRR